MNKRGLSYVDWVISVGLFIIFLILIFLVFQPAIITGEDKEYLAIIVKQGLEEDSFVDIEAYPIFIENPSITESVLIEDFPEEILFENTFVIADEGEKLVFRIDSSDIRIEDLTIDSTIAPDTVWIINSLKIDKGEVMPAFGGGIIPTNYSIGIGENIRGFYPQNFEKTIANHTTLIPYDSLKDRWNFPQNKNFQLYIYSETDLENPIYEYEIEKPGTIDNVRTLFYSASQINIASNNEAIEQNPIFILIRVW